MAQDKTYQTENYRKQGGATTVIGANGVLDIYGTVQKDGVDLTEQLTFTKYVRLTLAQVNAGVEVLPAISGKKYRVTYFTFRAIGGAFGGLDSIELEDGDGTPVVVASAAVAALTENALLFPHTANVTPGAGFLVGTTTGEGINITKTGSAGTTATHLDVVVVYQIIE